ncbi:MAG TPA: hypothetical protein VL987_17105 [Cellvibrio sp.]|nr:hypothetical protein [Cellvibrio sp.]
MALTLFFPFAANAAVPADIPKARIAVLGGTFLNDIIFHREGLINHPEMTSQKKKDHE